MEIRETINKNEWEEFLAGRGDKTFLQSWAWGDFNLTMGNKIRRLGVYFDNKIFGAALVIKVAAKRGVFLFVPHGPIIDENLKFSEKKEIMRSLTDLLKKVGSDEGAAFIRISPLFENTEKNLEVFSGLGFREAPIHASAYDATWKLDIFPDQEVLLKNMRKTTRYLIKKTSANPEISIEKTVDAEKLRIYQELNKKNSRRQKFVPFSDGFIKNEFEVFKKDNGALLMFGKYKGEAVAGALIIFWGGTAFYHQAASVKKFAKHSIPYLLQWEAIKEAKAKECSVYDFWGFKDPEKFPKHPWAGPTLFKMGFGGYKKEYVRTQDYIISQKYWLNYIIEKLRKTWRGL